MSDLKPSNELRFVERETVKVLQQKWYEERHPDINYVGEPFYIWVDVPVEQE